MVPRQLIFSWDCPTILTWCVHGYMLIPVYRSYSVGEVSPDPSKKRLKHLWVLVANVDGRRCSHAKRWLSARFRFSFTEKRPHMVPYILSDKFTFSFWYWLISIQYRWNNIFPSYWIRSKFHFKQKIILCMIAKGS